MRSRVDSAEVDPAGPREGGSRLDRGGHRIHHQDPSIRGQNRPDALAFVGVRWILDSGWLPKKSRLWLADRRAKPSRIRLRTEGTRTTHGERSIAQGSAPGITFSVAAVSAHFSAKSASGQDITLTSREHAPNIAASPADVTTLRCLTEKCLTTRFYLTASWSARACLSLRG